MDCARCQDLMSEAILGPAGAVGGAEMAAANAHAASCPACRAEKLALEKLSAMLPTLDQIAARIPEKSVSRVHEQVMASVGKSAAVAEPAGKFSGWRWVKWGVAAAVLLGLGLSAVGKIRGSSKPCGGAGCSCGRVCESQSSGGASACTCGGGAYSRLFPSTTKTVPPAPQEAQTASVPKAVSGALEGITDASAALKLLQTKFDAATVARRVEDFAAVISLCDALAARWPGTDEGIEALKAISRCYTQMGEPDKARAAYLACAAAAGEKTRQEAIAAGRNATAEAERLRTVTELVKAEMSRLFYEKKDYLAALAYGEALVAISPEAETRQYVRFMRAQFYAAIGEPKSAIAEYERIAASKESSAAWRRRAFMELPELYAETKRFDRMAATYVEIARRFPDDDSVAWVYYNMGLRFTRLGGKHCLDAIVAFNTVIEQYPQSGYATESRRMLASLNTRMLENPDETLFR